MLNNHKKRKKEIIVSNTTYIKKVVFQKDPQISIALYQEKNGKRQIVIKKTDQVDDTVLKAKLDKEVLYTQEFLKSDTQIIEHIEKRKKYIFIQPYLGETLKSCFDRYSAIPPTFIFLAHMNQLIERVEYLHNKNYVHLDIKKENIVIDANSHILNLIDFETVSLVDEDIQYCGTKFFMAPEIHHYHNTTRNFKVAKSQDIYSLGLTMLLCLVGNLKYLPEKVASLLNNTIYMQTTEMQEIKVKCALINNILINYYLENSNSAQKTDIISLIENMLLFEPTKRPTITQVKETLLAIKLNYLSNILECNTNTIDIQNAYKKLYSLVDETCKTLKNKLQSPKVSEQKKKIISRLLGTQDQNIESHSETLLELQKKMENDMQLSNDKNKLLKLISYSETLLRLSTTYFAPEIIPHTLLSKISDWLKSFFNMGKSTFGISKYLYEEATKHYSNFFTTLSKPSPIKHEIPQANTYKILTKL